MSDYFRPIVSTDTFRPNNAYTLAGGWAWFTHAERMTRQGHSELVSAEDLPTEVLERLVSPRTPIAGMSFDRPKIMGILNVTPDSFSDGGKYSSADAGVIHAREMVKAGADILDIGGESTRPGAKEVKLTEEVSRTEPVIRAFRSECATPISIDTRKAAVGKAALEAGANLINDVSAFSFDAKLANVAAQSGAPVCLMHAQGTPETMQKDPNYQDVLFDVFDYLQSRIEFAESAGIPRSSIVVDPGIGFGKTQEHNLRLLKGLSLYHGLGCPILLGVSRKRFIGTIGNAPEADQRDPGSVAIAMAGVSQGAQVLRVHNVADTAQALALHMAVNG